mmetsp:Transcript_82101/g.95994  ORF Transcript_82101/g.95994 Transcript_82101/m.95994 type:complete len:94 (+) Transcript_82101:65-346(+)
MEAVGDAVCDSDAVAECDAVLLVDNSGGEGVTLTEFVVLSEREREMDSDVESDRDCDFVALFVEVRATLLRKNPKMPLAICDAVETQVEELVQ